MQSAGEAAAVSFLEKDSVFKSVIDTLIYRHASCSKNKLISPADLQIDWRPLYQLTTIYFDNGSAKNKLYRFST